MSSRSYLDPELTLNQPILWLTCEKFSRNSKVHAYLILEYIKCYQTSASLKNKHVIHILDFKPLKNGELQRRVSHLKKVGRNITAGNTEKDLFLNFAAKTENKVRVELTNEQKENFEKRVKYYVYHSADSANGAFFETVIKDRFFSSAALDFLTKEVGISFVRERKFTLLFENVTSAVKRILTQKTIDPELDEIYDHVVLVHSIDHESAFIHGLESAAEMGIIYDAMMDDQNLRMLTAILATLTPEGVIGKHLDLEQHQFNDKLIDRPHLHWCWNMLVEPNSGGKWERARIAILEPLSAFTADKQDHLFGLAPYDTLTMGKHLLSSDSIILVPESLFEKARAYLTFFKGCIICYDEKTTTLRQVVTRILKKYYPNVWHLCDERGKPISNEGRYSETGFRPMTCMRTHEGKIIRLIEGENKVVGKSMQFPADRKRFIGLHEHSHTFVLETDENAYFKTLKRFKNNPEVFRTSPLFAGNIEEIDQLSHFGSLTCLSLFHRLQEYAPETGSHEFADYLINEALYADVISLYFSKSFDAEFSSLDFQLITMNSRVQLLAILEKINAALDQGDNQAWQLFRDYRDAILQAFDHQRNAKLKTSSLPLSLKSQEVVEESSTSENNLQEMDENHDFSLPDVTSPEFLSEIEECEDLDPESLEIAIQRHLFKILARNHQQFKLFDCLLHGDEKAADSYFKKYRSFFCHPNFVSKILPIIAFQNQFIYIYYFVKKDFPVNRVLENGYPLAHRLLSCELHDAFEALVKAPDFQISAVDTEGNTLLHLIAQKNDERAYAILEEHSLFLTILNHKNGVGETAILIAGKHKRFNLVDELMELEEIDLATTDVLQRTLLHYFIAAGATGQLSRFITLTHRMGILTTIIAVENQVADSILFKTKNHKILRWLIKSGFDLTRTHATTHETLLFVLVRENSADLVQLYCKTLKENHPVSVEQILNQTIGVGNREKKSPLSIAYENNYPIVLRILINEGAYFYINLNDFYILDYVATLFFRMESYNVLIDARYGNVERALKPLEKLNALRYCCSNGEFVKARNLIRNKILNAPIPDSKDPSGNGLLLTILKAKSLEDQHKQVLVKLLLQGPHKDDVNQADNEGRTPLMWAAKIDSDSVECLLDEPNIGVDLQDLKGNTALHYASSKKFVRAAQTLLLRNADPNIQNQSGETPLHLAKDLNTIQLLVMQGANLQIRDNQGHNPYERAELAGKRKLAQFLKESTLNTQGHEEAWHIRVFNKLASFEISAQEIIEVLSENSRIKECYDQSAGVSEGYTVGQHTLMVLDLAQRYRLYLEPQIKGYIEWRDFLLFLSIHDIGKGVSKDIVSHTVSAKELELEANRKMATWILEQLWVRSHVGHLFQALLMYDSQGDYLKGNISANRLKEHILDMSAISNLSPHAFYQIYTVFHLVDAASYPNLQPLFIFEKASLRHCEGNQSLINSLHHIL